MDNANDNKNNGLPPWFDPVFPVGQPVRSIEEILEDFGANQPNVKRREAADTARMNMLLQGAERYP